MSKELPSLTPNKIIQILEKIGFQFLRQTESHKIFVKDEHLVIVPFHNRDLKKRYSCLNY